ncbi:MAG TPA: BPSS1780 family membrane protein, partial [Candidatus Saccharimonadia bacterium]|nr:BPSS1780 family membrane protein [Candidatus Saccharimonadia bacterium]
MSYRSVELGRGVNWLTDAVALVMKAPAVFLIQALIVAIISVIPILGQLAMLVLGPAFLAGLVWSMREADQGREPQVGQLFEGFTQPGKIGALVALCLPAVAGIAVLFVLGFLFLGGALLGAAFGGADAGAVAAVGFGAGMLLFVLVCLLVALAIYSLIVFAIPRVMFDGAEPFQAMKESLSASLANIGPLLVFSVIFFIAAMIVMLVLSIIPILGTIVAYLLVNAVLAGAIYV